MAWLVDVFQWWSAYYGDHRAVAGAIRYAHLVGIVLGGDTALAADRAVLVAGRSPEGRDRALAILAEAHRVVVPSLAVIAASGAMMFAADTETFLASRTYGVKIAAVGLLAANGWALTRAERQARTAGTEGGWAMLRWTARASSCLWLGILLLGVLLTFAA